VGQYQVREEREGFSATVRSGLNLVVGQEAVINRALAIGTVTEQVTEQATPRSRGVATFANLQTLLQGTVQQFAVAPISTPMGWRSLEGADRKD
jgi:hypothetical protein